MPFSVATRRLARGRVARMEGLEGRTRIQRGDVALAFRRSARVHTKISCVIGASTSCPNRVIVRRIVIGRNNPLSLRYSPNVSVANGCITVGMPRKTFFVDGGTFCMTSHTSTIGLGKFHTCLACTKKTGRIGEVLIGVSSRIATVRTLRSKRHAISIFAIDNIEIQGKIGEGGTLRKLPFKICVVRKGGAIYH